MYAIANISGKQYKVEAGSTIVVDRLKAEVGESISFPVMLTVDGSKFKAGTPVIKDVVVNAKVVAHVQDKKITVLQHYENCSSRNRICGFVNSYPTCPT